MIFLKPVEVREEYIKAITKGMTSYFWERMFKKIFETLANNQVINSKNDLIQALQSGKVYYENGAFKTDKTFSNAVALELEKLGATFKYGAYYLPKSALPVEIEQTLSFIAARETVRVTALSKLLLDLLDGQGEIPLEPFVEGIVDSAFKQLEKDIIKSAIDKKVPVIELGLAKPKVKISKDKIKEVNDYWKAQDKKKKDKSKEDTSNPYLSAPTLDITIDDVDIDYQSKKIAQDYVYNMKYWVKDWEAENIIKMREDILEMYQKGAREPTIQKYIEKCWKKGQKKAAFLAENETNLIASIIKASRYQKMGATRFKWVRSSSKEKRILHRQYYDPEYCKANNLEYLGDIFEYDNPPIIDEKLGIRGLPRQIWNCKCHQAPALPDFQEVTRIINAKRNIFTKIKYHIANSTQRNNYPWRYRRLGQG